MTRVRKLDRPAHSTKQLIKTVEDLENCSVGSRSLTEAIDTSRGSRWFVFHIFCELAESQRGIIRERTRAGLDSAVARGRKAGQPPKLSVENLKAVKAALADLTKGIDEVAQPLGAPPATQYRHLAATRSATAS